MKKYRVKRNRRREIIDILISFTRKMRYDYVTSFSGHAALFLLMSLFPMLMYFVSVFNYLPIDSEFVIQYCYKFIPATLQPFLEEIIEEAYREGSTAIQSATIIVTLVCASKGVYAIVIGMNAVYGIRETRNFIVLYTFAIIYVMAFFAMIGLTMFLIVFGNTIFTNLKEIFPQLMDIERFFSFGKYIFMFVVLFLFMLIIYMNIPNRKSRLRYEIVGSLFSAIGWIAFSWVFSYYIDHYADYTRTYGSLAAIVIFILWLYGSMYILFIGAEINVVLRKFAEYGYNYHRAYEYYNNEYEGDLINEKGLLIQLRNHKNRGKK